MGATKRKLKGSLIVYAVILIGVFIFRPSSQWGLEYTIINNMAFAFGLSIWIIIPLLLIGN